MVMWMPKILTLKYGHLQRLAATALCCDFWHHACQSTFWRLVR